MTDYLSIEEQKIPVLQPSSSLKCCGCVLLSREHWGSCSSNVSWVTCLRCSIELYSCLSFTPYRTILQWCVLNALMHMCLLFVGDRLIPCLALSFVWIRHICIYANCSLLCQRKRNKFVCLFVLKEVRENTDIKMIVSHCDK